MFIGHCDSNFEVTFFKLLHTNGTTTLRLLYSPKMKTLQVYNGIYYA